MVELNGQPVIADGGITRAHEVEIAYASFGVDVLEVDVVALVDPAAHVADLATYLDGALVLDARETWGRARALRVAEAAMRPGAHYSALP